MFVNKRGKTHTYARTGEAKWVKITYLEDQIRLSKYSGELYTRNGEAKRVKVTYLEGQIRLSEYSGKLNSKAKGFSIPSGLTTLEQEVYKIFLGLPVASKANNGKAPGVIVITDLAKDYDDLVAIVILKELYRLRFVYLEAFIVNLELSRKRAIYRRVALDSLGLQDVLISISTKASGYSIFAEDIPIPRDDAANNTFDWPATEKFHLRLENKPSNIYTKVAVYVTNILLSEKGIPLPEDGTLLPDPSKDLDSNENFDPNKYEIIPYLTKGLIYNTLASLITGGDNLVAILGVLNTEKRIAFVISTILKGDGSIIAFPLASWLIRSDLGPL
ncbi:hypothetical protein G7Y89_g8593 [Cudoniella acicularis]|uniref:Uncharacterized protein n=1 Tax=Cudoniella acicularis TaxID=354080 RepID=A0A8H4RIE7_9HELO|nr:hypothetical protein G7Y89_g8593 [Cudoniella acicularis]